MSEENGVVVDGRFVPAEWENEPNQLDGEFFGLKVAIRRNHGGALCGYVGVSMNHPLAKRPWDDNEVIKLEVHGGVTWANADILDAPRKGLWWFGFDCAHLGDYVPKYAEEVNKILGRPSALEGGAYRNMEYVKRETCWLAFQLAGNQADEEAFEKALAKEAARLKKGGEEGGLLPAPVPA